MEIEQFLDLLAEILDMPEYDLPQLLDKTIELYHKQTRLETDLKWTQHQNTQLKTEIERLEEKVYDLQNPYLIKKK